MENICIIREASLITLLRSNGLERWINDPHLTLQVVQRDHLSFPNLIQCMIAKGDPWFSWLVNRVPPPLTYPAQEIACLMIRAYENRWFPLIRPAIKPSFLRGVREGG